MTGEIRWNRRLVAAVTVAGVAGIAVGAGLQGWTSDAWGGVLVEVGAGLGLVAAIVFIERRLLQEISERAESTAREAATRATEEATAGLRDRVTRLEDLERAQETQRQAHAERAQQAIERVRASVSFQSVRDLLAQAAERNYFAPDLRVRGADDPQCQVLYLHLDDYSINAASEGPRIELSFDPRFLPSVHQDFGQELSDAMYVSWYADETVDHAANKVVALLDRLNLPLDGFDLAYAVDRLVASFELMQSARAAATGSAKRLDGELEFLINDGWALTTAGLEAVHQAATFPMTRAHWARSHMVRASVSVPRGWSEGADASLQEALGWLRDREDFHVHVTG